MPYLIACFKLAPKNKSYDVFVLSSKQIGPVWLLRLFAAFEKKWQPFAAFLDYERCLKALLSQLGVATAAKVFVPFGEANMNCCDSVYVAISQSWTPVLTVHIDQSWVDIDVKAHHLA